MKTKPVISVVMSVFNAEKYLQKSVDSILNQTFSDFEFIIIEDGSADRSLPILEGYAIKDPRIILIKKGSNKGSKGFIENLNLGLNRARGKYIARMDADDISLPERFERQINLLEKDPELFIVGSSLQKIDENDQPLKIMPAFPDDLSIKKNMLKSIALFHPAIMFRNSDIRYREKMVSCEDYDLYFRLILQNKKMANIEKPLLQYRILSTSLSRKDKTFFRWMMVEKARSFYLENKNTGRDTYPDFDPEELSKITCTEYKNSEKDLFFAAKTALKFSLKEELDSALIKIKMFYPESYILIYKIAIYLPDPISKLYAKLFR